MLLCMERTFEYRMRPNTTQEAALFTVLKASRRLYTTKAAIGLDMGLTSLVTDSEGHTTDHPKAYRKSMQRLAGAQQQLSRCQKGSHRRRKAAKRTARIHEHIANQRKDALHKVSRQYVNQYQTIVIEDLQPANMVRNHALALSISDS